MGISNNYKRVDCLSSNYAGDKDLHKLLVEVINQGKQEHDQLESLLKENNVGLPPSPPERPKANLEDIPRRGTSSRS